MAIYYIFTFLEVLDSAEFICDFVIFKTKWIASGYIIAMTVGAGRVVCLLVIARKSVRIFVAIHNIRFFKDSVDSAFSALSIRRDSATLFS